MCPERIGTRIGEKGRRLLAAIVSAQLVVESGETETEGRETEKKKEKHTHRSKVGKNGDDQQRHGIEEADRDEHQPSERLVPREFSPRLAQVLPHEIFGVGRKRDRRALGMLVPQQVRDDVGVRDSCHRRETVLLGLAIVDVLALLFDRSLRFLQPLAVQQSEATTPNSQRNIFKQIVCLE